HIWVATRANGVVRVHGEQVFVVDQRHGLPELPVYGILEDHAARLWLSSPGGLFAVSLQELDAVTQGKQARVDPLPFLDDDGLRTVQFQNVGFPSAWRDPNGHLWFPSVRGLVEVRPKALENPQPPRVLTGDTRTLGRAHEIRFTSNRLQATDRVEFRYRLSGWQPEWIPLGRQRSLRLDSLSPGDHVVEIAARLPGSTWGAPVSVLIHQPPRWFETGWFYALCLAALLALLWTFYKWRVSHVRARFSLVAAERNRIGREWHDTLLAGFSAISWQLESALKALEDRPEAASHSIQLAGKMVSHYRNEARRVIWDLRHAGAEHEGLANAIERSLREIVRDENIERSIEVEGDPGGISAELAQGVLRICQEAALNASRHADAKRIEVRLQIGKHQVQARIADDGKGFDPAGIEPGHFGVAIMKERAARFGGSVHVESAPGAGTTVVAELPLAQEARA
ncbi:MAG: ATP-binding protein, partial [Bryobacterales bacterium]|nr:ATP-binding protein [Bryobacterales bacterium]